MQRRLGRAFVIAALSAVPAAAESVPWTIPSEAMSAKGERLPCPAGVVRGESGAVGVFVFERDAGLTLRVSRDGRGPWKVLLLPNGAAGEPLVDGDRVELLLADADDKSLSFGTIDLAAQKEVSRIRLPGKLPGFPGLSRLVSRGPARFAIVALTTGEIFYSRSADAGKTWSGFESVAKSAVSGDACCPPLLMAENGPHLLYVSAEGVLAHRVSADGAAWKEAAAVPGPAPEQGVPRAVAGAQSGKQFHLVVLTSRLRFLYNWSDDGGVHWGGWSGLASPSTEALSSLDLAETFRLKARGRTVAFTWTERGPHEGDPLGCRFLVSRTGGAKWEERDPAAHVKGSTGLGTAYISEDERITVAFAAAPGVARGKMYVLVTREGKEGEERGEGSGEWWGK